MEWLRVSEANYSVSQISVINDRVGKCRGDSIPALDLGCITGISVLGCFARFAPETSHQFENRYNPRFTAEIQSGDAVAPTFPNPIVYYTYLRNAIVCL
ncbi:MAG: hypothetical protein F6J93_04430 [Oscillatoria sp. SIO1A7]|nr:hypothetical protein [Oscillatoria sp. SIO1A7]